MRVVARFEVSKPRGSIVVHVLLTVAPGPVAIVLWSPAKPFFHHLQDIPTLCPIGNGLFEPDIYRWINLDSILGLFYIFQVFIRMFVVALLAFLYVSCVSYSRWKRNSLRDVLPSRVDII